MCKLLKFTYDAKPLFIFRYFKVISYAVQHFKKYNLDALFVVTNAPGRSAYNRVERRMAPLSSQLSGLVLKHDTFGSHLDNRGKTVDKELELKNFEAAANVLANIWSEMVIDSHPVVAEFIKAVENPKKLEESNHNWYIKHVQESQYLLQVNQIPI